MKNKELTSTIKTLGTGGQVSLADIQVCVCLCVCPSYYQRVYLSHLLHVGVCTHSLQAKRMTPAMESFLYAVAVADGFSKAA